MLKFARKETNYWILEDFFGRITGFGVRMDEI
jgi:hypothetical protein